MKLTRQQQKEIMQVHEAYWAEYLKGNVEAVAELLDSSYTQVGSAESEVFYTKKEAVQFLHDTIEEVTGKLEMRNRKTCQESQDGLVLVHETCDLYALDGKKWIFYSKFRATTLLREKKEGWKLIHQHSSFPDSKTDEGQNVAIDKIAEENRELREAVKRRTTELVHKNRELEIEASLERIRAQAMAMRESADLLDIVVTLRNEFIALGHEAHYLWHMRWLPKKYEKAMTSGDGTRIGMVMELPRHIHGDIPLLAKWEKGKKPTVIYAMDVEAALDYVDKMVTLGDFQQLDPNAPTEEDIRHIGGLTFVMARTTHGEIGYSLPGAVEQVPEEDLEILVRFAGAFDLAHKRFEDLKKSEQQAREVQIELALEKVRSRTMGMQESSELKEVVKVIFDQLAHLNINAEHAGIVVDYEPKKDWHFWIAETQDIPAKITVPYLDLVWDRQFTEAKKKGQNFYTTLMNFEEKNSFYKVLLPHIEGLTKKVRDFYFNCPGLAASTVIEKDIGLYIENFSGTPYSREENDILKRFAKVFQQTYTRFLDLQKAEAQTREAQIEAALERVRSRSMAMHESGEMLEVIEVVSNQLKELKLNFDLVSFAQNKQEGDFTFWMTSRGQPKPILMEVPTMDSPVLKGVYNAKKKKTTFLANVFTPEENREWHEHLIKYSNLKYFPEPVKDYILNAPGFARSSFLLENIDLYVGNYRAIPFTEEENSIFKRFAQVFEQAYTRFLDLQKAEAQAREAQIENALEKVRSRTMAMQKGEEVKDVVVLLYQELIALGVDNFVTCGYVEINEEMERQFTWVTAPGGDTLGLFYLPLTGDATFDERYAAWKRQQGIFHQTVAGETRTNHLEYAITTFNSKEAEEMVRSQFPDPCVFYCFNFSHGYLHLVTGSKLKEEEESLLARFTRVFEQTYARFLDLKKAEAQAREAQIENALEKVRSRTMAMQKSHELPEAANNLFLQVQELGIPAWSAGYCIWESEDKKAASCNMSSEGEIQKPFILPTIGEGYNFYDPLKKGETFYIEELGGDALVKHYEFMRTLPKVGAILEELINAGLSLPTFQIFHILYFPHGYLMFITYEQVPEAHDIFKRFAKVFEQTYTRFLDLQKAEAQSRESQIEAALERVRSRTMGMQKSEELGDVAAVLFKELNRLVDNLWTCGFVLCEEGRNEDEWWLSDENGFIPAFYLPNVGDEAHANIYNAWKNGADYHTEQLEGEALQKHYDWLMNIPVAKKIFDEMMATGFELPTWQKLHCAFFKTGYLVIITQVPCPEEEIFKRFAQVFDLTYTRFLDLQLKEEQAVKLVEEKQRLEVTLSDLRATQSQLVQSEKMASLGELTAGIAHEIQNPLNFVNNFSEVSKELLEEMMEEMQKGDVEEVKALVEDIIQNLDKIHHHGQRADGIVKGMLQHSRTSSGEKEPTDLSFLADEYLRLAYHGLRAKDKMFNATLETHFDESIGKVNVIPQDMGRVLLNLITNAFYVVQKKKEQQPEGYNPTVTVTTRKEGNKVLIAVKDNGNGIPDAIKEKIFQPFFTTKPTGQGTGLGLSMSYDIVTKGHGGSLEVKSEKQKGSEFIIILPIDNTS